MHERHARAPITLTVMAVLTALAGCTPPPTPPDADARVPSEGGLDASLDDVAAPTDARADHAPPDATTDTGSLIRGRHDALFVGNSYIYVHDVAGHYRAIANAMAPDPRVVEVTTGGYLLAQHARDALTDGTPLARWLRTGTADETAFDAVILQEQSQTGGFPAGTPGRDASVAGATQLAALAQARGAAVVLYLTWGRKLGDPTNVAIGFGTFTSMQDRLDAGYLELASILRARGTTVRVAPVGGAFRIVFEDVMRAGQDPLAAGSDFDALYEPDGSHQSLRGAYLAACVIEGTVTGADARGFIDEPALGPAVSSRLRDACARALADARWRLPPLPADPDGGVVPDGGGGPRVPPRAATIAAGGSHSCAVQPDATVRCWGDNSSGALGDGTGAPRVAPVTVAGLADVAEVATGRLHSCARLRSGAVRCWGANPFGQLGDGTTTTRLAPVEVVGLRDAVQITAAERHTCARLRDDTVWCWGGNPVGQLGDGTMTARASPVQVTGLREVAEVAAGDDRTCARLWDGTARCWGVQSYGPFVRSATPVAVPGLRDVVEITAGGAHACARLRDGTLRCWGANETGAVGDGGWAERTTPVMVAGLSDVAEVSAGWSHTCARSTGGAVRCWGFSRQRTPAPVAGLREVDELATGHEHTCARLRDGSVRCWGANTAGEIMAGGCCHGGFCGVPDGSPCGPAAEGGGTCSAGACTGCGAADQPCCDAVLPASRRCPSAELICDDAARCVACGGSGQPCCAGAVACRVDGEVCDAGRCVRPGEPGAPCLADNRCTSGCCVVRGHSDRVCAAVGGACPAPTGAAARVCGATGSCGACGGLGQPCCSSPDSATRLPFYCSAPNTRCDASGQCVGL